MRVPVQPERVQVLELAPERVRVPVQPERVQVLELAPVRVPELVPVQADRWALVLKVPQVAHLGSRRLPLETHKCRY